VDLRLGGKGCGFRLRSLRAGSTVGRSVVGISVTSKEAGTGSIRSLVRGPSETRVVELLNGKDVDEAVDGLGENVEDTVEDHLGVRGDSVGTIGKSPCDGVEEPENGEDDGGGHVGLGVVGTELGNRGTSVDEEDLPDTDEGEASETEESPLVAIGHKGTDESSDDHDDVEEEEVEGLGERETGSEGKFEEKERSGESPVDVSCVPNGTSRVKDTSFDPLLSEDTAANVLNWHSGRSVIGSHGIVGNTSGKADSGSQLVESPFTNWSTSSHQVKTDARETHDSGNDPLELVSTVSDVDVGTETVV